MSLAFIVFLVVWLAALVGSFIPVIPSTLLVFLGGLTATFIQGFDPAADTPFLVVLVILTLVSSFADNIATAWGAGKFGGSQQAIWGALVGGIVGMVIPFGLILGPLLGALLAELLLVRKPLNEAARSAFGTLVGLLSGMAAKFVLNLLIGIWALQRFWEPAASLL